MPEGPAITSLTPTQRDPNRVSVKVDRKHLATLSVRSVDELGLRVGLSCGPALREAIEQAGLVDKAMKQAMNRLDRRALTRFELDRKLKKLEHDDTTRRAVLDRLESLGLLDDRAYAEALVRSITRTRPAGPKLLKQKLWQKGVPQKIAEAVLAEAGPDAESQAEQAIAFAQKKAASMERLDAATRKRRLYGQLARRGFDRDAIDAAMQSIETTTDQD